MSAVFKLSARFHAKVFVSSKEIQRAPWYVLQNLLFNQILKCDKNEKGPVEREKFHHCTGYYHQTAVFFIQKKV